MSKSAAPLKTTVQRKDKEITGFGVVKNIFSAFLGIPMAAAASVIAGTVVAAVEWTNVVAAGFSKNPLFRTLIRNPATQAMSNFCQNSFEKMWTKFGISAYLDTAKFVHDTTGDLIKESNNPEIGRQGRLLKLPEAGGAPNLNIKAQNTSETILPDCNPRPISGRPAIWEEKEHDHGLGG